MLKTVAIEDGPFRISLKIQEACFGEELVTCETGTQDQKKYLDVVLYHGEEKSINFNALSAAYITFALAVGEAEPEISGGEGQWAWPGAGLTLRLRTKPATAREVRRWVLEG